MKTVKIVQIFKDKYEVIYDFKKPEITREELEMTLEFLVKKDRGIFNEEYRTFKEWLVNTITFVDDLVYSVDDMIAIWDCTPEEVLGEYFEHCNKDIVEFLHLHKEEIIRGYSIDCPFDGGSGEIEHLNSLGVKSYEEENKIGE